MFECSPEAIDALTRFFEGRNITIAVLSIMCLWQMYSTKASHRQLLQTMKDNSAQFLVVHNNSVEALTDVSAHQEVIIDRFGAMQNLFLQIWGRKNRAAQAQQPPKGA